MKFSYIDPQTGRKVHLSRQESRFRNGSECIFIPISKKVALKVFPSRRACHYALQRQKKAAAAGLGPTLPHDIMTIAEGFDKISEDIGHSRTFRKVAFAYFTHIARGISYSVSGSPRAIKLEKALRSIGLNSHDVYNSNVGFFKRRFVMLDFGALSVM